MLTNFGDDRDAPPAATALGFVDGVLSEDVDGSDHGLAMDFEQHPILIVEDADDDLDLDEAGASQLNQGAAQTCVRYAISSALEDQLNFLGDFKGKKTMEPESIVSALMAVCKDAAAVAPQRFDGFAGNVRSMEGEWYEVQIRVRQNTAKMKQLASEGKYAPTSREMGSTQVIVYSVKMAHAGVQHEAHCVYLPTFDLQTNEWVGQGSYGPFEPNPRIPFDDRYHIFTVDVCSIRRLDGCAHEAGFLFRNFEIDLLPEGSPSRRTGPLTLAGAMAWEDDMPPDSDIADAGPASSAEQLPCKDRREKEMAQEQLPCNHKGWARMAKEYGIDVNLLKADPPSSMDDFRKKYAAGWYTNLTAGAMAAMLSGQEEEEEELAEIWKRCNEDVTRRDIETKTGLSKSLRESHCAVVSFNPDIVDKALARSQEFVAAARTALPNIDLLRSEQLKTLVEKAQEELDSHAWAVNDFLIQIDVGINKLNQMATEVESLLNAGARALQRVKNYSEPWNYGDIETQVNHVAKRFLDLSDHTQTNFTAVKAKLNTITGKSMGALCYRIRGRDDMIQGVERRSEEKTQRVLKCRTKMEQCKAEITFMDKEKEMLAMNEKTLEKHREVLQHKLQSVAADIDTFREGADQETSRIMEHFAQMSADYKKHLSQPHDEGTLADHRKLSQEINLKAIAAAEAKEELNRLMTLQSADQAGGGSPGRPQRPTHFLILVDEGYGAQKESCKLLAQLQCTLRQLSISRSKQAQKDQVSLVCFHFQSEALFLSKKWSDLQTYLSEKKAHFAGLTQGWFDAQYRVGLDKAEQLLSEVVPDHGSTMDTVLILCTDGQAKVTPDDVNAAFRVCEKGNSRGSMSSFVVTSSEKGQDQLKFSQLTAALNSGATCFTDVTDTQHLFFSTTRPNELLKKVSALTETFGDPTEVLRTKYQRHNDKMVELQHLLWNQEREMKSQEMATRVRVEARLKELGEEKTLSVAQAKQHLADIYEYHNQRKEGIQDQLTIVQDSLKDVRRLCAQAEVNIQIQKGTIDDCDVDLRNTQDIFNNDFAEYAKQDKTMMDSLGNVDANALHEALKDVHDVLMASRKALFSAMDSFQLAANPVEKLINSLLQTQQLKTDHKAKAPKVLWAYSQCGVAIDDRKPEHQQFSMVISHICHGKADTNSEVIENLTQALTISDFIAAVDELDAANISNRSKRSKDDEEPSDSPEDKLKAKLIEGLARKDEDLENLTQVLRDGKAELDGLELDVIRLQKEPANETKEDRAERRSELKGAKAESAALKKANSALKANLTQYCSKYRREVITMTIVLRDVESICHRIELQHGMSDAHLHMTQIKQVCQGSLSTFLLQAQLVSNRYSERL